MSSVTLTIELDREAANPTRWWPDVMVVDFDNRLRRAGQDRKLKQQRMRLLLQMSEYRVVGYRIEDQHGLLVIKTFSDPDWLSSRRVVDLLSGFVAIPERVLDDQVVMDVGQMCRTLLSQHYSYADGMVYRASLRRLGGGEFQQASGFETRSSGLYGVQQLLDFVDSVLAGPPGVLDE